MEREEIQKRLKKELDKNRYEHTLGVMYTAGSLANNIDPIFQIGKASLTPEIIEALDAALEKRELIKVSVLKNCIDDPKEIASVIAERTHSNVVKVIGKKMIFYRKAKKNPKIKLPE